ncbi:efflux RND transporter permease subunit [Chondromyces crocatus]|uniref:RND transporter n=1 Tax=Chondromyces crocatus TaxID=52 RepID=A0A0K1EL60_CHOCO|nr:efflux RND transporter permease subunit [Chondromyces crocatus]AKT41348.1 RND transporter [Chondromyces crocatus]
MKALVALFIRRPVFTWVLILGSIVLGLTGLLKMPVERFPNVDFAYVSVSVSAPGMSAEQVESEIATRIENALGTVSGLDRLDSTSSEGHAFIAAQFVLGKDSMEAANEVRDRISRLAEELPPSARPPSVETFNVNSAPILLLSVQSPAGARTPRELTELADTTLRRELQSIRGVGDVRLIGGETRTLSIVLDPLRLLAADLTAQEVQRALAQENLEAPGGSLTDGAQALGVRLSAKARTAADLERILVARRGDTSIRLADVADVDDEGLAADARASLTGKPAVLLAITKQPGANTVSVTDDVRARVDVAQRFLPDGVEARILQDNSEDVRASVAAVTEHLLLGALLAAVVVLLFLRSFRATLIAGLAIPASILGTFAVTHALGMTLNLLSLLGLTLAVGIVIDDAIVVLENIVRVMQTRNLSPGEAAVEATREIGLAVLATTLSLVAVFLPIATMEGIVGRYLSPFGLTMSVSILLSMAVAFTLTPMLCSRWLAPPRPSAEPERSSSAPAHAAPTQPGTPDLAAASRRDPTPLAHEHTHDGPLERLYARALTFLLRRRWIAGVGITLTLLSTVVLVSHLPTTFVPTEDLSRFSVYLRLPESASLDRTAQVGEQIATLVRDLPDVDETALTTLSAREATVTAYLSRRGVQSQRIQQMRERLRAPLTEEPLLTMVGPADDFAPPGPEGASIQFVIRGAELNGLQQIASALLDAAKGLEGTVDHGITSGGGRPELSLRVDRSHASKIGVSQAEIGSVLALIDRKGVDLGSVRDPHSRAEISVPVRLRVASSTLNHEDLVRTLTVRSDQGQLVPLATLAEIERDVGPGSIRRVGRQRQVTLFMNTVPGTSDSTVIEALHKKLRELDPTGRYQGEVIGNASEMQKTFNAFLTAIFLSFVFMYLVLAAQYESWLHPVTILMSLPLTVPFGLLSLLVGGQSLNLFSALGFLVLFGVVKKNSILQIDRILQLRAAGVPRHRAILDACRDRLRPILMTTIAFVAGMLPLVISSGPGAATNRAIAVGVLGGQTLSLVLTLLATPILYTWFDDLARMGSTTWTARLRSLLTRSEKRRPNDGLEAPCA